MEQTWIGDFLLVFTPGSSVAVPTRSINTWQLKKNLPTANLYFTEQDSQWKGFPLTFHQDDRWQTWLLGEMNTSTSLPEPGVLLDGPNHRIRLSELNGQFLLLAYDRLQRQWHLSTDRFATLHAYYAWDGRRAALGTFSPAVAAAASKKQLDWEALTGFFAFGFFPADRTHYTDLHILRPASHYVFDEQGRLLSQERYWNWVHTPDLQRSYSVTVDQFAAVFGEVMAESLAQGRVAVPVSGGLDSRSTVAAVTPELAESRRLWAYSYGYTPASIETRIASQIARARRIPVETFTISQYLFKQMELLMAYTEGFQDITQARQMSVRDDIATNADTLISALWGGVWHDDMGLVGHYELNEAAILAHTLKKMLKPADWLLQRLALPHLNFMDAEPLLESFVQAELAPLGGISDPDFRVKAYKTEQWSFRWSLPATRVFQSAVWPAKVFYDTRITNFFATVPSEFVVRRRLEIDYLRRYASDLARITWQVYDANLYTYQHFNTWLLPRRALKKVWRQLSRQPVVQRNWEVQFLNPAGQAGLQEWLLRPGLRLHEFVSPAALQELYADFYSGPERASAYALCMLLTFSAWLECYG